MLVSSGFVIGMIGSENTVPVPCSSPIPIRLFAFGSIGEILLKNLTCKSSLHNETIFWIFLIVQLAVMYFSFIEKKNAVYLSPYCLTLFFCVLYFLFH